MAKARTNERASGRGEPSAQDTGTAVDQEKLARSLSSMARQLQGDTDVDAVLADIVRTSIGLIPGADEASISMVTDRKNVSSQHPTGDLPRLVDAVQTETGQGPCLQAVYEQQTVRVPDMRKEQRWPEFTHRAAELGAASMLSFQLYVERDNLGALNLYSRTPDSFTDESEAIGLIFASHAAVAFADLQEVNHLRSALESRDVIGQAKGMLMERFSVSPDQAFRILIRISQAENRKLVDLAEELTLDRDLPGLGLAPAALGSP